MRELSLLLTATAAILFSFAALWYSWKVTKAEPAVQTFVWEETTYIVATGPDGSVAITAHFDPLP
jgi:hypothetical protein